jgi:hypothetical protein
MFAIGTQSVVVETERESLVKRKKDHCNDGRSNSH